MAVFIALIILYLVGIGVYWLTWFMIVDCSFDKRWGDEFNRKGIAKMILWPITLLAYICAGLYLCYKFIRYDAYDGFKEFLKTDLKNIMDK